jgi:triosephosphate isomerase (TIM)
MSQSRILLAGNWKMHLGPREAEAFLAALSRESGLAKDFEAVGIDCLLFPPALSLDALRRMLDGLTKTTGVGQIRLGVQQIHPAPSGAFTGETSAEMAAQAGATHGLVGHSERRHVFGESDAETLLRVRAAFRAGLHPVLCVGETLEERRQGALEPVLRRQLDAVLTDPEVRDQIARRGLTVAYEPVWAIGTGETATPADAAEAHGLIRAHLAATLGVDLGGTVPILYGGSVKPSLAEDLLKAPGVAGLLVGGASLDPASWSELMQIAYQVASRNAAD